jgi:hypothetical protein
LIRQEINRRSDASAEDIAATLRQRFPDRAFPQAAFGDEIESAQEWRRPSQRVAACFPTSASARPNRHGGRASPASMTPLSRPVAVAKREAVASVESTREEPKAED